MSPAGRSPMKAYATAVACALAGLVVTALVAKPLAGPFFMFQFAAVVGAALYGGLRPGLVTMALSALGFYALFFAPRLQPFEAYRLGSFVLVSVFFAWLASKMRDAKTAAEASLARAEAAEAEARRIGAQQERLVAVVSHDLRNPLNAITVTAEHLQRGDITGRQAKALSRIVTSTLRMQAMVRELLDYARARHVSGIPVRPRPVHLGEICRGALEEVQATHASRTVLLDLSGDDLASLDPARVEQVVCNLVANALEHGAADAAVRVSVTGDADSVRLDVSNEGAPIPQHLQPVLFDAFRHGDANGSVGLGLYIVREIARAHGGNVAVRSDGGGTTFTVILPRGAAAGTGTAAA